MDDKSSFGVSEARSQLSWIVQRATTQHEPIYLERHGRRVAAVIDAGDLDRLIELSEDMADIRAAQEARDEMRATGEEPIPWDQVKAELGLT
jgi:prevent-host-death family protein